MYISRHSEKSNQEWYIWTKKIDTSEKQKKIVIYYTKCVFSNCKCTKGFMNMYNCKT